MLRQIHKTLCKTFVNFVERPRPNDRRAIFVPEKGDKPYFIWLPVEPETSDRRVPKTVFHAKMRMEGGQAIGNLVAPDDLGVPDMDAEAQAVPPAKYGPLGRFDHDTMSAVLVCGKLHSGELLDHSIMIMVPSPKHFKEHGPNQCFKRLATQDVDIVDSPLCLGPSIIYGMNKANMPTVTVDLDTNALTLALDAVIGLAKVGKVPEHAKKVPAVKVNFTSPPFFEHLEISPRHPAFKSGTWSGIAELVAAPMRTWYYSAGGETKTIASPPSNTSKAPQFDAKVLQTCIDVASRSHPGCHRSGQQKYAGGVDSK